ncbi:MAG: hypothetical protein WA667_18175 [Candidatus Nitrosopolaris sp.]
MGLPVTYTVKDFTDKPLQELRYVVSVNLHRRHLDKFQRAEIGLKIDKIARKIARERQAKTLFTTATRRQAAGKRFATVPSVSADAHCIDTGGNTHPSDEDQGPEDEEPEGFGGGDSSFSVNGDQQTGCRQAIF